MSTILPTIQIPFPFLSYKTFKERPYKYTTYFEVAGNGRPADAGRALLGLAGVFVPFSFTFLLPALDHIHPPGRLPACYGPL